MAGISAGRAHWPVFTTLSARLASASYRETTPHASAAYLRSPPWPELSRPVARSRARGVSGMAGRAGRGASCGRGAGGWRRVRYRHSAQLRTRAVQPVHRRTARYRRAADRAGRQPRFAGDVVRVAQSAGASGYAGGAHADAVAGGTRLSDPRPRRRTGDDPVRGALHPVSRRLAQRGRAERRGQTWRDDGGHSRALRAHP